jgi:hypothetical protein
MSTSLAHLALYVVKDCDADQALRVRFWSAFSVAVLSFQLGWLALAAILGSLIGLGIIQMASQGARSVRKAANAISASGSRDQAESSANNNALNASVVRGFRCKMQKAFCAAAAIFSALGVAHVSLSRRLFPCPILNCV